jgi:hypothetical protein
MGWHALRRCSASDGRWPFGQFGGDSPDHENLLLGVSCPSPRACVAVGLSVPEVLAESWNGTVWKIMATPKPAARGRPAQRVMCRPGSVPPWDCNPRARL